MELLEEIRRVVTEELGISETVKTETQNLINKIARDREINNLTFGYFHTFLFGKKINVKYRVVETPDEKGLDTLKIANPGFYAQNENALYTTIAYLCDRKKYVDFNGTTEHEVKHFFQIVNSGKQLLVKNKSRKAYDTAVKLINSYDYYEQIVGWSVYYACKFERDAFMSTLYRKIVDNWSEEPIEVVTQTNLYKNLKILSDEAERTLPASIQRIEDVCETYFNKHYNWWKNTTKKIVSAYINKIGKVLAKAEKDMEGVSVTPNRTITNYPKFNKEEYES